MSAAALKAFGSYLVTLRTKAGLRSQDDAIAAMKRSAVDLGVRPISKSVLSLYERGAVMSPKPHVLRMIAAAYGVTYDEVARRWFSERYGISPLGALPSDPDIGALTLPSRSSKGTTLISVAQHCKNQAALPKGAEVGIAAVNFVDSDDKFFQMTAKNLRRGVRYCYLLPQRSRTDYDAFLLRVLKRYPDLKGKKLEHRCRFIPRPPRSLPVSYVLYLHPTEKIEGFVALPGQEFPSYYLVADPKLSLLLYDTFHWARGLHRNAEVNQALAQFQFEYDEARSSELRRTLFE